MTWGRVLDLFQLQPLLGHRKHHHTQPTPLQTAKMVLAKSKKSVGLGNSLMNDRFGKGKGSDMRKGNFQQGIERTGQNGERVSLE